MCFSIMKYKYIKNIYKKIKLNTKKIALQSQGHNVYKMYYPKWYKNTFLSTSYETNQGSITLEAALTMPVLLLVIFSLTYFSLWFNFNIEMQNRLNIVSQEIDEKAYNDVILQNSDKLDINETNNISNTYLYSKVIDKSLSNLIKKMQIDKTGGIHCESSSIDNMNGINNFIFKYKVPVPFLDNINLPGVNKLYFRSWIGSSIQDKKENTSKTVYITKSGSVYHTNKNCCHLNPIVHSVNFAKIKGLRNKNGEKYYECEICKKLKNNKSEIVYISDYGNKFHYSNTCYEISRNVIEIDISEVGNRKLCARCRDGK